MNIRKSETRDLETVKNITADTINKIYPRYYPKGAVDFFLAHHSTDNIKKDIISGNVYFLTDGDISAGTVTAKGNEICRLFVLPQF